MSAEELLALGDVVRSSVVEMDEGVAKRASKFIVNVQLR